jgi:hypothetical protein
MALLVLSAPLTLAFTATLCAAQLSTCPSERPVHLCCGDQIRPWIANSYVWNMPICGPFVLPDPSTPIVARCYQQVWPWCARIFSSSFFAWLFYFLSPTSCYSYNGDTSACCESSRGKDLEFPVHLLADMGWGITSWMRGWREWLARGELHGLYLAVLHGSRRVI